MADSSAPVREVSGHGVVPLRDRASAASNDGRRGARLPLTPTQRTLLDLLNGRPVSNLPVGTDWEQLGAMTDRLWLGTRLAGRASSDPQVPEVLQLRWSETQRGTAAHNLLLEAEQASLLKSLANAGVEAVPLKGTSLARILRGDPAARPVTDIDLGIRSQQAAGAAKALRSEGFEVSLPVALLTHHGFLRGTDEYTSEIKCTREVAGVRVMVELHWKWLPLSESLVWSAMEPYPEAGVRTLCPEHYFLFLCSHVAGGNWAGLRWLCDVADFLSVFGSRADSEHCRDLARQAHLRRAVGITLALVDDFFGIRTSTLDVLRDATALGVAAHYCQRPFQPFLNGTPAGIHRDRLRVLDSPLQRVGYLARLLRPTHMEWLARDGSMRSAPAAWIVRGARLARLFFSARGTA